MLLDRRVTVVVLLLSGQCNSCILISGKPGTCEKIGMFQCNNGKCILKDNSDMSRTDDIFCGMLLDSLVALTGIFSLTC